MNGEALILCEGYQDRAFWAGALIEHFGCQVVLQNKLPLVLKHRDDAKGVYHYRTRGGRYVHVYPCAEQPRNNSIRFVLEDKLKDRARNPFEHILVNPDVDTGTLGDRQKALAGWVRTVCPGARATDPSTHELDVGKVALLCWNIAGDFVDNLVQDAADRRSIPDQQTLERLACAALCAVYPGRGANVRAFIDARVDPPAGHLHKAIAMSHMAGWYADKGSADIFYHRLWQLDSTRSILLRVLAQQPTWSHVAAILT